MELRQVLISTHGTTPETPNLLVARSEGVSDTLCEQLLQWSPRRNGLEYGQRQAIGFFALDSNHFAIMRSVVGPMDSQMQRQVVSSVVLINPSDLARFYNNGGLLLHYLRSAGHLILPHDPPPLLPEIKLGNRSLPALMQFNSLDLELEQAAKATRLHRSVALLGMPKPAHFAGALIQRFPIADRAEMSFSIGMRASDSRPYRVYLFHDHDPEHARELASRQIRPLARHDLQGTATSMLGS